MIQMPPLSSGDDSDRLGSGITPMLESLGFKISAVLSTVSTCNYFAITTTLVEHKGSTECLI
jgi:hypothetical protein